MKAKFLLISLAVAFFTATQDARAADENNCMACHAKLMKKYSTPVKLYSRDIHSQVGLICSDCHGGDPSRERRHDRNDPAQQFLGAPGAEQIPAFCDRCHGNTSYMRGFNPALPVDQLVKYRTSRHGQLLLGKGDTRAANCVSCHSVHDIYQAGDPGSSVYDTNIPKTCAGCHSDKEYMAGYSIPTDQYTEYAASVHGAALLERGDVGAPACNDCHGNHGAVPVEVADIFQVCGMCHVNNERLYRESFHSSIFEELEMPGCETCHGNHAVARPDESMLGAGDNSACGKCHEQSEDDPGFALGLNMKKELDSLSISLISTSRLVESAGQQGMEISELSLNLRDIRQSLIKSRTAVHTFDDIAVADLTREGIELAAQVAQSARKLLAEHGKRRWWLGGATLVLLAMILALYLKLRAIEK